MCSEDSFQISWSPPTLALKSPIIRILSLLSTFNKGNEISVESFFCVGISLKSWGIHTEDREWLVCFQRESKAHQTIWVSHWKDVKLVGYCVLDHEANTKESTFFFLLSRPIERRSCSMFNQRFLICKSYITQYTWKNTHVWLAENKRLFIYIIWRRVHFSYNTSAKL